MEPFFKDNDKILFFKYLDKATNYLDFGSGGSTYNASIRDNIKLIISNESDYQWYNKCKKNIKHENFTFNYINLKSKRGTWGTPGNNCSKSNCIKYSDFPKNTKIDLVLIDGRFRVACCLKCFDNIDDNCFIIFDDFLNRKKRYQIVLDFFDIIEKTTDKRMVVLKKKKVKSPSKELINKYELICG